MKPTTKWTLLASSALLIGLSPACNSTQVDPAATTGTARSEISGTHARNDLDPLTAQRYIDRVRIGGELAADGSVPAGRTADRFPHGSSIYVGMEVTDAPAGSKVRLSVVDATAREVWKQEKPVEAGKSHLNFQIDSDELADGEYAAKVIIGDETVANRSFTVTDGDA